MRRHHAFFAILCLGLALAVPAQAQNKKAKAKRLFDKGVAALEDHDYKDALESFNAAYKTSPHWAVLAHIGTCQAKLSNPVEAISALEQYLEEGGEDIPKEERQAARQLLTEQRKKVGVLHLIVEPDGSEAKIDGDSVGKAPFDRILLKAGPHHVMVIADDEVHEKDIHISPGQEHTVRIPEEEAAPPAPAIVATPESEDEPVLEGDPEETEEQESDETDKTEITDDAYDEPVEDYREEVPNGVSIPFFVALGVAGAGLITGGVGAGLLFYYKDSEDNYASALKEDPFTDIDPDSPPGEPEYLYTWDKTCGSGSGSSGKITVGTKEDVFFCTTEANRRDFRDKAQTALIPTIVGSGVFVLGGTAAILFYFHPEWFSTEDGSASIAITPIATSNHTGLVLTGSF